MNKAHATLWQKIKQLRISVAGAQLSFSQRLARENGWSEDYTERVVEEYKRFLLLSAVAGHSVTPSDQVDQAWHLHLAYTRNYWDTLCKEILGFPLHHGPTAGGEEEGARYQEQYAATLASYQKIFDETPPDDIWPSVENRFKQLDFRRVNVGNIWLIRKPPLKPYLLVFAGLFLGIFLYIGGDAYSNPVLEIIGFFVSILSLVAFVVLFLVHTLRKNQHSSDHGCSGAGGGSWGCGGDGDGDGGCGSSCGGGCGGD